MEWPEYNRGHCIVVFFCFVSVFFFLQDISALRRKWGTFLFTPSFRCGPLVGVCPSLAHRLEPSGQRGATMCWEWEHLSCGDVDVGRVGYPHCSLGAFVSDTVPLWGLMRTNWSEWNKWIMELDKSLYFVCCSCWDPPIICPLSPKCWLESAWSGLPNVLLSLSGLFITLVHNAKAFLWQISLNWNVCITMMLAGVTQLLFYAP